MSREKFDMEIQILHSYIVQQNPKINPDDAAACARAYGEQLFGDRLISVGPAEFSVGPHGKIVHTTMQFWEGTDPEVEVTAEPEVVTAGAEQTFPHPEGA